MDDRPALRAILLGASNLKAALPLLLAGLRRRTGGAIEVLAACGHGRSYGMWSRFLFVRRLPGIAECGLWRELSRRPPLPAVALVTDIGNDLLYGARAGTIAAWVGTCLDRLAFQRAEIALSLLPLPRLESLSAGQYLLARSLLFPGRNVPWETVRGEARELDEKLLHLGKEHGARLIRPEASWYGLDPIHILRSRREEVWRDVLSGWTLPPRAHRYGEKASWEGRRLPAFGAEEFRLLGFRFQRPQPVLRFDDGTTLSLF
jgi:hypothetical protein